MDAFAANPALPWRVKGFATVARPPQVIREVPDAQPAVRLIREKNPEAWRAFFEQEMPAIYRYAYARLGDPGRAEDATADVFEQAWKSAGALEDLGHPPRAWLFGIARNVVNSHRRWLFRRAPEVSIEAFDGGGDDAALAPEKLDLVRAIAALDRPHAEVITLRFLHGLSLAETAVAIGASVDAVKGRQARALMALRDLLTPETPPVLSP